MLSPLAGEGLTCHAFDCRPALSTFVGKRDSMASQQSVSSGSNGVSISPRFAFDARRWTRFEVITAGLSLALPAFLPRPWYHVHLYNCPPPPTRTNCQSIVIGSVGGTAGHSYLWLTVLPLVVILAVLFLRAGFGRVSFLIWPDARQLLAGAACANLVIVSVAFLTKSGVVSARFEPHPPSPFAGLSITWESAAYVALAIAVAAAMAAVLNLPRVHRAVATSTKQALRGATSRAAFLLARAPDT